MGGHSPFGVFLGWLVHRDGEGEVCLASSPHPTPHVCPRSWLFAMKVLKSQAGLGIGA